MAAEPTELKLPGTPKPWMNRAVMTMLGVPGLRSMLGRGFLIITVTGARTGHRYTTPVQYVRDGDHLVVLSQRHRTWWRNLRSRPDVEVQVSGARQPAVAHLADGDEGLAALSTCLRLQPRVARFYGVDLDDHGEPDPDGVARLAEAVVVIIIEPRPEE